MPSGRQLSGFCDALLLHHGFFNDFQPLPAGDVDFLQVGKQLFSDNEIGIQNADVLLSRHGASGHISRYGTLWCLLTQGWE